MKQGIGKLHRVHQPEQCGGQGDADEEGEGGLPADDPALPQPQAAQQVGTAHPFPAASGKIAEDAGIAQDRGHAGLRFAQFEGGFQRIEGGCAAHRVDSGGAAKNLCQLFTEARLQFDGGPLRHQRREGDDTDGKADHRRVEGVLPEPAIKVFGDDDGEQGADDDQPPGSQRREGEG